MAALSFATALGAVGLTRAAERPDEVIVVNRGMGGHTSRDGLARFERDVLEVKSDHLILYFGTNDACNSRRLVPLDEFRKNLQAMIDRARAAGTQSIILVTLNPVMNEYLVLRHPTHPFKDDIGAHQATYDIVIREVAQANELPIADLRKLVEEHGGAVEKRFCLIRNLSNAKSQDGVHLTQEGYRKMAELFEPILKERIRPGHVVVCMGDSITYGAHVAGAGTSYGETYPAWLWLVLNRMTGATERKTPRDPPRRDPAVPLLNGGFEESADRVHPDGWRLWNVAGTQEGQLELVSKPDAAHEGRRFLRVVNANSAAPACLNSDRANVEAGATYRLAYRAQGEGTVKAQILRYVGRKFRDTVDSEPVQLDAGPAGWKQQKLEFGTDDGVTGVVVRFRVTGTVSLDGVALGQSQSVRVLPPRPLQGAELRLKNRHMDLRFYPPEQGGGIRGLRNASGYEFVNGACDGTLWKLQLRRIPGPDPARPDTAPLRLDPEQDDGALPKDGSAEALLLASNEFSGSAAVADACITFEWRDLPVAGERDALDVTVTASLAPDDRFARFRTRIVCRSSRYTVFYVTAPFVNGLYPPDQRTDLDRLASPVFNGRLISDPIRHGILGKPYRFQANRSGHSMQFDALYHDGNGLYLGCFDGDQNAKRYTIAADPGVGVGWGMVHIPNNMKSTPQDWSTPYDTVLCCFSGDWYDACRIYRQWALQQTWTAEGPLQTRKSVPRWFKEMDDWMSWAVVQRPKFLVYDPKILKALNGLNVGVIVHHWGKGSYGCEKTPERFPLEEDDIEYLAEAKKQGFPVLAYIQGICWDMASESFGQRDGFDHTVRNFYDQRVVWNLSRGKKHLVTAIAYPGSVWAELLGNTIVEMAKAGFATAYLDSFNHAGTYLNFNPLYTDECGGGNRYIKDNQALLTAIKARARAVNPDFCFTSESFWEGNMAHIDGYLVCNTTNQPLEEGVVEAIPMAQAVYHDYTVCYSNWNSRWDLEQEGARSYLAKYAQTFVWGVKSAWTQPRHLLSYENHEIALDAALKRGTAYAAAKEFLVYGEMLRPPELSAPAKRLDVKWYRGWSRNYYDISMPAVLHSFWRAPNGAIGLVLYNIDDEDHAVTLRFDDPAHGLVSGSPVTPVDVARSGVESGACRWDEESRLTVSLLVPARSPRVLKLQQ